MFNLHPTARVLHSGVRVNLLEAKLDAGDGTTRTREIAEVADAVVILPLVDASHVVLIENQRFTVNDTLWELPAGTVEADEDLDVCAGRELTEETGYTAAPGSIERLTSFFPSPGFCTEMLHAYRATDLTPGEQSLDDTERITPHVKPLSEAIAMIRDGRIRDAKSIATLLFHHAL